MTPVADDLVGVAVLSARRATFAEQLGEFPVLRERLVGASAATAVRGAGPLRQRAARRVAGRVLLVGDARGVDALTGEGSRWAWPQARAAVAAVAADRPVGYEREWRRVSRRYAVLTHAGAGHPPGVGAEGRGAGGRRAAGGVPRCRERAGEAAVSAELVVLLDAGGGPWEPRRARCTMRTRLCTWPSRSTCSRVRVSCCSPGEQTTGDVPRGVDQLRLRPPGAGERLSDAASPRRSELGATVTGLRLVLPHFAYRAEMDGVVENEMCPVFAGWVDRDQPLTPDRAEVADTDWVPARCCRGARRWSCGVVERRADHQLARWARTRCVGRRRPWLLPPAAVMGPE